MYCKTKYCESIIGICMVCTAVLEPCNGLEHLARSNQLLFLRVLLHEFLSILQSIPLASWSGPATDHAEHTA